jgi:hypothetical protein
MQKRFSFILITCLIVGCTSQQLSQTVGILNDTINQSAALTSGEVASGLKEALIQGISKGSNEASAINGFLGNPKLKIPFPPDALKVANTLRDLGLGNEVDKFVTTLNRGAEEAAKEAKPIFVDAIKSMTIEDAFNILKGENNAATEFLHAKTQEKLTASFTPVMESALKKVNATKYYGELVERYNRIPLVEKVNPDLTNFATQKAVDGLFILVAQEEANIRKNPAARATELLKKVFAAQDPEKE